MKKGIDGILFFKDSIGRHFDVLHYKRLLKIEK